MRSLDLRQVYRITTELVSPSEISASFEPKDAVGFECRVRVIQTYDTRAKLLRVVRVSGVRFASKGSRWCEYQSETSTHPGPDRCPLNLYDVVNDWVQRLCEDAGEAMPAHYRMWLESEDAADRLRSAG